MPSMPALKPRQQRPSTSYLLSFTNRFSGLPLVQATESSEGALDDGEPIHKTMISCLHKPWWFIALLSRAWSTNPVTSNPGCSLPFYQGHGPTRPVPTMFVCCPFVKGIVQNSVVQTLSVHSHPETPSTLSNTFFSALLVLSALLLTLLPSGVGA